MILIIFVCCIFSYDMIAITKLSIVEKFPVPSLGIDHELLRYKTNALATESKSRLSDAVVKDSLYTRSYAKPTLCGYVGDSALSVTIFYAFLPIIPINDILK